MNVNIGDVVVPKYGSVAALQCSVVEVSRNRITVKNPITGKCVYISPQSMRIVEIA